MRKINSSGGTLAALLLGSALIVGACTKADDNSGNGDNTGGSKATGGSKGSGGSTGSGGSGSGGSSSGGSTGSGGSSSGGSTGSGGSSSGGSTGSGGSSSGGSSGDASASGGSTGSGGGTGDAATEAGGGGATFAEVLIILKAKCGTCHDKTPGAGGFSIMGADAAVLTALTSDTTAGGMCAGKGKRVVAGSSATSVLYLKLTTPNCGAKMPKAGAAPTEAELGKIKSWIDDGAKM
jgi:hypothetical protein